MEQESSEYDDEEEERRENQDLRILASSCSKFCTTLLDFKPYPYQMEVLEDPSRNIIVCAARRVGKSLVMAHKALWFAFCKPGTSTLIVAATQRQSMLMFDKLLDIATRSDYLKSSIVRHTRTLLTFKNGSRIVALPCGRNGKTIRGEEASLIIVDEAAFVADDVILSVLMPMLATTDGTMIMISTPWDKGSFFYQAFHSPIWTKYKFKTADNPAVKKEWLDQQLEMLGEKRFKQEYLAEFVDDEGTYFPIELLRPCVHMCEDGLKDEDTCYVCASNSLGKIVKTGSSELELYAGYDPGGMQDPAALAVIQKMSDDDKDKQRQTSTESFKPAFRVLLTKTFALSKQEAKDPKSKERDLYTNFNVKISELHKAAPFRKVLMDSTGIGLPILSHCKELGLPVEGMNVHIRNRAQLYSNLKILFEQRKIEIPDSLELLSSLNCLVAEPNRIGEYTFSHPGGTHDDLAFALALAVWRAGRGGKAVIMKDAPSKPQDWRISQTEQYY